MTPLSPRHQIVAAPRLRLARLFLHYFDVHFLELQSFTRYRNRVLAEARLATRLAYLAADEIVLPAASYFESALCRTIIDELGEIRATGAVRLLGNGLSLDEFIDSKRAQYARHDEHGPIYRELRTVEGPPFRRRSRSATRDIAAGWRSGVRLGDIGSALEQRGGVSVASSVLDRVPDDLGDEAFIVDNVARILVGARGGVVMRNILHSHINEHYFGSFTQDAGCGIVVDMGFLEAPHPVPSFGTDLSFKTTLEVARRADLLARIDSANPDELLRLRESARWLQVLHAALRDAGPYALQDPMNEFEVALVKFFARKYTRFPSMSRVWTQCGGDEAEVPDHPSADDNWNFLWLRARSGAAVSPERLVLFAGSEFPRSPEVLSWCRFRAAPPARSAFSSIYHELAESTADAGAVARVIERGLATIPDVTEYLELELGAVAAAADTDEHTRSRARAVLTQVTETLKAGAVGAWKATVESAFKAMFAAMLATS